MREDLRVTTVELPLAVRAYLVAGRRFASDGLPGVLPILARPCATRKGRAAATGPRLSGA
ncbi:hypothetical protein NKH77_48545 [Streptomyces sp. M19]